MSHKPVYQYLRELTGIDVSSIGEDAVDRIVASRMSSGGYGSADEYLTALRCSPAERQELINEVTVPETWFFRDDVPFQLLSSHVRSLAARSAAPIRILSVPCSTGEEPYSIAMALFESGVAAARFSVDAVDISSRVIEMAKRGIYGRNSFRGGGSEIRDKYFTESGGLYEISDRVKGQVVFQRGNILDLEFMDGKEPYDIIFCRNMLIYFDMESKERVIRTLYRHLSGEGLLFLGHAETGRVVAGLFESARHPGAFAYRPIKEGKATPPSATAKPLSEWPLKVHPVAKKSVSQQVPNEGAAAEAVQPPPVLMTLDDVRGVADKGELERAISLCEKYLKDHPADADGYCLKGVIQLAMEDDEQAATSFKKAVYLQPRHYQSLAHLMIIAEEQGDLRAADNFRARMERAMGES